MPGTDFRIYRERHIKVPGTDFRIYRERQKSVIADFGAWHLYLASALVLGGTVVSCFSLLAVFWYIVGT